MPGIRKRLKKIFKSEAQAISVDVLTGYRQWAKNYPATAHNPLMEIEGQAMLSLLPDPRGKVCLDLACGSGRYMLHLQARQARQIFGLDYSPDMLVQANHPKSRQPSPGQEQASEIESPKLVRSSFLALPFAAGIFDLITCGLAIGHEKNLNQVLAEAARVLHPGGSILYSDFHPFGTLAGWQRSFTTDNGDVFNLEHYLHLYSDHQRACRMAGLTINAVMEPSAGVHAPAGFHNFPAVLVIRAVKTE